MENTKFTPGPWNVSNSDFFNEATNSHLVVQSENDEWEICHMCDGINGDIGGTMIANARLIAAAPEMCRQIQDNIRHLNIILKNHPESAPIIMSLIAENMAVLESANIVGNKSASIQ